MIEPYPNTQCSRRLGCRWEPTSADGEDMGMAHMFVVERRRTDCLFFIPGRRLVRLPSWACHERVEHESVVIDQTHQNDERRTMPSIIASEGVYTSWTILGYYTSPIGWWECEEGCARGDEN